MHGKTRNIGKVCTENKKGVDESIGKKLHVSGWGDFFEQSLKAYWELSGRL